jgi:polynucleotide 5'-kinase involved in rRNA processing
VSDPLLGPPHTNISHTNGSKKCYFLGHLSPNDVPSLYIDILQHCRVDFQNYKAFVKNDKIPLIVNTMGWNVGLGLCLLKETILAFKPSHLIQINHPQEANKNMPTLDTQWLRTTDGWPPSKRPRQQDENSYSDINDRNKSLNYNLITLKSRAPAKSSNLEKKSPSKRFSPRDQRNIAILA